jgi:hypothetical protein
MVIGGAPVASQAIADLGGELSIAYWTPSGGAVCGGTSSWSNGVIFVPAGGAVCGGTAPWSRGLFAMPVGGAVGGGVSPTQYFCYSGMINHTAQATSFEMEITTKKFVMTEV